MYHRALNFGFFSKQKKLTNLQFYVQFNPNQNRNQLDVLQGSRGLLVRRVAEKAL